MKRGFVFFVLTVACVNAQSRCVTPQKQTSQCVSIYDCPELLRAFEQRPLPSSTINFLRQSQCGFEGYTPRVCCGPLPSETRPATTSRPQSVSPPNANIPVDPVSNEDSYLASRDICGIDKNGDRIYNGQFTELDEFPWMALLGYRTRNGSLTYQCGGVLINRRYVLTAAHCVKGAIETQVGKLTAVRLGEYDVQTEIDCLADDCAEPVQDIAVEVAYPHPGFVDGATNREDDIALVRLAQRVNYTYYVQPICLAESNSQLIVGNDVYVAGWGKTLDGRNSPIKLKLKMPIFDKGECASKYGTRFNAKLTNKQICAGGVFAQDACRGDSGGPLMKLKSQGVWESVAVVSFGNGCGNEGWPGVYSSVASYRNWIESTLRSTNE